MVHLQLELPAVATTALQLRGTSTTGGTAIFLVVSSSWCQSLLPDTTAYILSTSPNNCGRERRAPSAFLRAPSAAEIDERLRLFSVRLRLSATAFSELVPGVTASHWYCIYNAIVSSVLQISSHTLSFWQRSRHSPCRSMMTR